MGRLTYTSDKLPTESPVASPQASHHDGDDSLSPAVSSAPFLGEKPLTPRPKFSLPTKESLDKFSKISSWAWITVTGQFFVLTVALIFFTLIQFTHTPMQQNVAEWGKASPRGLAFVVTAIATMLSAVSTYLFSKGLILLVTSHSDRPTTLFNFLTMTHLSRGAAIISSHHLNWTLFSLLTLLLLNSLTASFTALLTPTPLIINVPISGREFALDSDLFLEAINNKTFTATFPRMTRLQSSLNDKVAAVIGPLPLTSAYISASSHIGYPGVMSYLGSTLTSSTRGVLPAIPEDLRALEARPDASSFSNFSSLKPRFKFDNPDFKPSRIFPFNYTTIQQGFTADVTCQLLPNSSDPQVPGLVREFVQNVTFPDNTTSGFWRFLHRCPNKPPRVQSRLLGPHGSMVFTGDCPDQDLTGDSVPGSQLLIIAGYGRMYSLLAPRVCQFTPYFTLSEIKYSTTVNVTRIVRRTPITPKSGRLAQMVFDGLLDAVQQYVVQVRDKIGDDLASLYGITSDIGARNDDLLNVILENYFLGMFETRATLIRTPPVNLKRAGYLIAETLEDLSDPWTHAFNGTWSYETLGWHKATDSVRSTAVGIIPILLVTVTSIGLALYSWMSLKRSHHHMEEPFDPNNLVALLKAGRDGAVVNTLGVDAVGQMPRRNVAIQLHRNGSQWELRPVINKI